MALPLLRCFYDRLRAMQPTQIRVRIWKIISC